MASIAVDALTKRFKATTAVADATFEVAPGTVTALVGPNGSGKTTTLRCLLGLVHPDAGKATINGKSYRELSHPARTVGALLEGASFHPGRKARDHLRLWARAAGVAEARVDEMLDMASLSAEANKRIQTYSLGMRQRLAIAGALIGDPEVLVFDEPANGLDPAGIKWIRDLLRGAAGRGCAVLVSSHLLAEVAVTADELVIIHRGRIVAAGSLAELVGDRTLEDVYFELTTERTSS